MARHESNLQASADGPLSLSELLALLGEGKAEAERERQDAIACYLSASEGWSQAVQRLSGAFVVEARELKGRKAD